MTALSSGFCFVFVFNSSWGFLTGLIKLWVLLYRVWDTCTAWARCTETLRYRILSLCFATFSTLSQQNGRLDSSQVRFLTSQRRELRSP